MATAQLPIPETNADTIESTIMRIMRMLVYPDASFTVRESVETVAIAETMSGTTEIMSKSMSI